jgi:hypothetical protein
LLALLHPIISSLPSPGCRIGCWTATLARQPLTASVLQLFCPGLPTFSQNTMQRRCHASEHLQARMHMPTTAFNTGTPFHSDISLALCPILYL